MWVQAEKLLHKYFGYTSFRPNQQRVLEAVFAKKDTLAILPTGGGKSICYQIPAMLLPGVTLVISPLISLMKDQVDSLKQMGIPATYLNSTLSATETEYVFHQIEQNRYKMIYIAPERLDSPRFLQLIERLRISLIAIDEAHCISQWGHDFRPAYRTIPQLIELLPNDPPILALTATATNRVRQDICQLLTIPDEHILVSPLARENLSFHVFHEEDKLPFITQYLHLHARETGIIYCSTRKEVDHLHEYLQQRGFSTARYHAGMNDYERAQVQELFAYDHVQTIIATTAFGMGIDKSNVRYVLHYNLPRNLEYYYQEAGRAGRDGEHSECILLYQPADMKVPKFLITQSDLPLDLKEWEMNKLFTMQQYCHSESCLTQLLRQYFDDEYHEDCGMCSNCKNEVLEIDITVPTQKILSCIKRMREQYGFQIVSKVLRGSKQKQIIQRNLHQLSTYGILAELSEQEIMTICQLLISKGILRYQWINGTLPIAQLTEQASAVLKGEEKVLQKSRPTAAITLQNNLLQPNMDHAPIDQSALYKQLFEKLRDLRKIISTREQVAPYIIFHDNTLHEFCRVLPRNQDDLLHIRGIGERKVESYGSEFLAKITDFLNQYPQFSPILISPSVSTKGKKQTFEHTYRLYEQGMSFEKIVQERNLTEDTILRHLQRAHKAGKEIDWLPIIPEQYRNVIFVQIERLGDEKLKPLKEALPEEISYVMIKVAILWKRDENAKAVKSSI